MSQGVAAQLLTALEIATHVRGRSISALEATKSCLDRIEALDHSLHAFQVVRAQKALEEAAAVDRRSDLSELPLAGVPVAIKDNFDVAGEPTRMGSAATAATPAQMDDELVRRLRMAGAVVIGKTTMPELAIFGFTESAAYGITRNPWNPDRSPGGSTGGGAVAVATGMAPVALATDGLGSIRGPSSFCGVFGIKPTRGRLPLMQGLKEHWYGLSVTGPIAWSVRDAALMLDVLGGTNDFLNVEPPRTRLRVAVSTKSPSFLTTPTPEVVAAARETAAILKDAGHSVTDVDPPYPSSLANTIVRLWTAGVAQDAKGLNWASLEPRTRTMVRIGRRIGPGSRRAVDRWAARASTWFDDFDIAVMPVVARSSIPAGGWTGRGFVSTVLDQIKALPFNAPWNVAGFPAASVPAGLGPDQVPLSVQIVAPPHREAVILGLALQLESLRPWQRVPSAQH
jgi:amidase